MNKPKIKYPGWQLHDMWCYLMENEDKTPSDWTDLNVEEKKKYDKRPVKLKSEGTPGKFYFRLNNSKYKLVEMAPKDAKHHYLMCFESM